MILFAVAVVLFIIGVLLIIVDSLTDVMETKRWGMFFIIAAAAVCVVKCYLDNPEPFRDVFRSLVEASKE